MGLLTSLLVLSFLIFVHELGHFLAARYFGIHVEVFSIGFGKKVYKKVVGKTEYALSAIPLGGYVKMKGQEDLDPLTQSNDDDSYNSKHPFQRIVVLLAGPFANFLTAFVLYVIVAMNGFMVLSPTIGKTIEDSPAFHAGLQKGDIILDINRIKINEWKDVSKAVKDPQSQLDIIIFRNGVEKQFFLYPKVLESQTIFGETVQKPMIGIAPSGDTKTIYYSFGESFSVGIEKTIESSKMIFLSIVKLIEGVISPDNLGGIISIMDVTAKASDVGITALMLLTALISVNLGVLNLLPIPALDGGHIVFQTYELIFKRPPSEKILVQLTIA
ncbi:MAG: RIP metalloprotease RseP, partial [Campylobacterales bacterium]|nr:RIP metalloprotease RseP [Campylobacterales bacterium]